MTMTDDEREAYKRGRAAIQNLTSKRDRTFNWWLDYSNAVVAARTEAMREAFTNQPIGKAYNAHHTRIMKREQLDAFNANTRKDCVAMVDNLHHPVDARRAHGIIAWRSKLDTSTRARLNHPSAIMRRWKKDTEPLVESGQRTSRRRTRSSTPWRTPRASATRRAAARRISACCSIACWARSMICRNRCAGDRGGDRGGAARRHGCCAGQPEAELKSADPDTLYKRAWARFLQEDPAKLAELPVDSLRS